MSSSQRITELSKRYCTGFCPLSICLGPYFSTLIYLLSSPTSLGFCSDLTASNSLPLWEWVEKGPQAAQTSDPPFNFPPFSLLILLWPGEGDERNRSILYNDGRTDKPGVASGHHDHWPQSKCIGLFYLFVSLFFKTHHA